MGGVPNKWNYMQKKKDKTKKQGKKDLPIKNIRKGGEWKSKSRERVFR